jgi:alginate O-acetyltransferase complex protein AlgJ
LRYWAALLEARRVFLEKKGIHYLFLVAPDKHTIYPEHLPEVMVPVKPLSRTDQLIGYVGKQTKVRILDVRPAMVGAKPLGRLYFLTDTHWNTLGAFIAYQQIMGRVQTWYPEVKPLQLTDYSWEDLKFSGDLASMVALQSTPTEIGKALRPKFKSSTRWISDAGELFNSPRVIIDNLRSENPNAPIPKLVMFRDSFATTLLPYIAEHFHNAFFHWGDFETSVVEREKPDIVIEELLERRLMKGLPKMP